MRESASVQLRDIVGASSMTLSFWIRLGNKSADPASLEITGDETPFNLSVTFGPVWKVQIDRYVSNLLSETNLVYFGRQFPKVNKPNISVSAI